MSDSDTDFIEILTTPSAGDTTFLRAGPKPLPDKMPILGLADVVIFPGMMTPLLVESSSSIKLVDDVVGGDRFVGLVRPQQLQQPQVAVPNRCLPFGCGLSLNNA